MMSTKGDAIVSYLGSFGNESVGDDHYVVSGKVEPDCVRSATVIQEQQCRKDGATDRTKLHRA